MKTLLVRTLDKWREWLTEHHASESEVWLIFFKRHTGAASIDYKNARDEALGLPLIGNATPNSKPAGV